MILDESGRVSSRRAGRVAGATLAAALVSGCFQPATDADELQPGEPPPVDLFLDGGSGRVCPPDETPSPTLLGITVRTSPVGGRYQPRNVGAIWIETAGGEFVKTVKVWAKTRRRYLTRFLASSGNEVTDAVTGATLSAHVTHQVSWDLSDVDGCEVPDGDYQVVMELTDRNGPGATVAYPFTKAGAAVTLRPPDEPTFHDVTLTLQ